MLCFIPKAFGQYVPNVVSESLEKQGIFAFTVSTKGEINSQRSNSQLRLTGECNSRNKCVEMFAPLAAFHGKYVAMQDRDILHLQTDNFKRAVEHLEASEHIGAVALPFSADHSKDNHVRMCCVVYRSDVFCKLVFKAERNKCCCKFLSENIKELGYTFEYLPSSFGVIKEVSWQY